MLPEGQTMHRQIVSPVSTKLHLWKAPSSKLRTGETDMQTGQLTLYILEFRIDWPGYSVRSVIDPDEIPIQHTCHQHQLVLWRVGGGSMQQRIGSERGRKSSSKVVLLAEKPLMRQQNWDR